jgi:hypothetical protein
LRHVDKVEVPKLKTDEIKVGDPTAIEAVVYEGMPAPRGGIFQSYPERPNQCFSDVDIDSRGNIFFKALVNNEGRYLNGIFVYLKDWDKIFDVVLEGT